MTASPSKSALVTGATGFVGGHLVERLVAEGWQLKVLARDPEKLAAGVSKAAEVIQGDLGDVATLKEAVRDVDVVLHAAANVKTWDSRESYRATNVYGVRNLVTAIAEIRPSLLRLVHVSTVDVYGFPEAPCGEDVQLSPIPFGYSDSKREGEELVRALCAQHGIAFTVLRPANVIGPRSQYIENIGEALRSGVMLTVDGGRANAGLVYVGNLIDYIIWAARAPAAVGECYNVRDAYDVTWARFISDLRKGIRGGGRVIDLPYGVARTAARVSQGMYGLVAPAREPLLHPMHVAMFGRTCGHPADKIRAASGIEGRVGYDEALGCSIRWFLQSRRQ